jgi:protein involved in polysaccharide export with SLBB domain
MSINYSTLLSVFLGIFLVFAARSVSAQSTGNEAPSSVPNATAQQFTSSEAAAEAKRLYKAGVQYGDAGLFSQAANLFEQAIKLNPNYADAYASLGHAYCDLKQWDKAIPALEQALVLNPKHKDSQKRLSAAREAQAAEKNKPASDASPRAVSDAPLNGSQTNSAPTASRIADNESSLIKIYRVGPGDVLDVQFNDTSSGTFTVGATGLLEHPNLSQPLPVAGKTVDEIADRIQITLNARAAAQNAKVSVSVSDYVSHKILVSGLVKEPGAKILRREAIPLSVVIADAQRLPEAARAKVVRNESKEVVTIDLANDTEMNFLVRPGDVITLETEPVQFIYVGGEVKEPGEKTFRRGLTLTQAILIAGGFIGKPKEARVSRDSGNGFLVMTRYKLQEIDTGKRPDVPVQPGDRITVVK